ncbi:MAG: hypothetical protein JXI43_06780 [Tissierellales bacterium]|nr:hypothetical protein [Tissierellales bacterium]
MGIVKNYLSFNLYLVIIFSPIQSMYLFAQVNQQRHCWYDLSLTVEASQLDTADYLIFQKYLDESSQEPSQYVVEKCKKHQIVILGEIHHQKEYLDFFKRTISDIYHKANVRYVVLEVPLVTHNGKLEKLVTGKNYDRELAWEIIRSEGFSDWGDKDYWEILETVWSLNQTLPQGNEPMRIIGVEINYDFKLFNLWAKNKLDDEELIALAESQHPLLLKRDELMAAAIDQYVINKKEKGIVLIGAAHSYTHYVQLTPNAWNRHYAMPCGNKDDDLLKFWPRMGNILYQQHGDSIFQILFHYPSFPPNKFFISDDYDGEEPCITQLIENIMAGRVDLPVGFDVINSPFGLLRDSQSYEFHFQPSVKFSDICRGYIYLKPWKDMTFSSWLDGFISEELYNHSRTYRLYYDRLYREQWKDAKEIDSWYKEQWLKYSE